MSGTVRKEHGKKLSIFDIQESTENEDNLEIPPKKKRNEIPQDEEAQEESQLFDNDGFDDLDMSLVEAECSNNEKRQDSIEPSVRLKQDFNAQQKERAEKNRQKALALKSAKLLPKSSGGNVPRECFLTGESLESHSQSYKHTEKKKIDTGAGFFIEEDDDEVER